MEILHPIRSMAKTDGELATLIHSFFMLSIENGVSEVNCRHPLFRKNVETVEEGLKGLSQDILASGSEYKFTCHVLTNHDGRLYVFSRCSNNKIVSIVSMLPIMSFCKEILDVLDFEPLESILPTLYTFCEIPILPLPNFSYCFKLFKSSLRIKFSILELVEDTNIDMLALASLTPEIIVKAWEALIMERRILVLSSREEFLLPVCEFLRRILTPLSFIGTYIPILPSSGVEAVEAPGTFIVGAKTDLIKTSTLMLNGIVIIDLDSKRIIHTPTTSDEPYYAAPPSTISKLFQTVTELMSDRIAKFISSPNCQKFSNTIFSEIATDIIREFNKTNLSILSAQYCGIKAFFRTNTKPEVDNLHFVLNPKCPKTPVSKMGFSEWHTFFVGCVQLWKDIDVLEDAIHHTIPCWVELDNYTLAVYELADDLPLILLPIEEISSVSACSMEPEGHVFEISLKNDLLYRFTCSDREARLKWTSTIELKMTTTAKGYPTYCTVNSQQIRTSGLELPYGEDDPLNPNSVNVFGSNLPLGFLSPPLELTENIINHYHEFRYLFRKTQLVISLYDQTECKCFESLFTNRAESLFSFIYDHHSYETRMKKYVTNIGRPSDMLHQIKHDIETNISDIDEDDQSFQIFRTMSGKSIRHAAVEEPSISLQNETKPKGGLFHRLFYGSPHRLKQSSKDSMIDDLRKSFDLQADIEREHQEKQLQSLLERILLTTVAYNRCLSELNGMIVEDRINSLKHFVFEPLVKTREIIYSIPQIASTLQNASDMLIKKAEASSSFKKRISSRYNKLDLISDLNAESASPTITDNSDPIVNRSDFNTFFDKLSIVMMNNSTILQRKQSIKILDTNNPLSPSALASPSKDSTILTEEDFESKDLNPDRFSDAESENEDDDEEEDTVYIDNSNNGNDDSNIFLNVHKEIKNKIYSYLNNEIGSTTDTYLLPIIKTLTGYAAQNIEDYSKALEFYSYTHLIDNRRISFCLLQIFLRQAIVSNFSKEFSERKFIYDAYSMNPITGMHAYRLILELIHTELRVKLGREQYLDSTLTLGSFRYFPRTGNAISYDSNRYAKARKSGRSLVRSEFDWIEPETKSDIINEAYICTKLSTDVNPCELSTQLLLKLREILKSFVQSPGAEKYYKKSNTRLCKLKYSPQLVQDIQSLSAFKKFEVETSQLQKIDLTYLETDERLLFFINIHNILMTHSMIVKGSPGSNLLERTSFLRNSRYNVGGYTFSLIDIEHGVLRNASTKPMILGPLSVDLSFSERDPRRKFALEVPKPNVTFCLFLGCAISPSLNVLMDSSSVNEEMARMSRQFLLETIKFDYPNKTIHMPALLKVYWADFGTKQTDVFKYISSTGGSQFANKRKEFMASIGGGSVKTHFTPFDWSPYIIFYDN